MTLHPFRERIRSAESVLRTGRVRRILPSAIEADGPSVTLGELCRVEGRASSPPGFFDAEVVRVEEAKIMLTPFDDRVPTFPGATVTALAAANDVPVGAAYLGRAVDALGRPLDGLGAVRSLERRSLHGAATAPLARVSPEQILETGLRAIDGLLTLGKGQRIGIFAASGVGKTSLLSQLARQTDADVTVLCLIGERGREVEAIWNRTFDEASRAHATLVAATSDQPAALRVRASHFALALAEHWRAEGRHVLLVLDSVTRLAMALREIGLAAGEPPTVRAYTPNVFAFIPRIVERCGALKTGGAITAIMTVLSETDEIDDPVCELMKSVLDGHILLTRALAERAQFPAIDVTRSVSRQASMLVDKVQGQQSLQVLEWISLREQAQTLIDTGLYAKGSNPKLDRAVERADAIAAFLKQGRDERSTLSGTKAALARLTAEVG